MYEWYFYIRFCWKGLIPDVKKQIPFTCHPQVTKTHWHRLIWILSIWWYLSHKNECDKRMLRCDYKVTNNAYSWLEMDVLNNIIFERHIIKVYECIGNPYMESMIQLKRWIIHFYLFGKSWRNTFHVIKGMIWEASVGGKLGNEDQK